MRFVHVMMLSACAVAASTPAMAQQSYSNTNNVPVYNTGAAPLPMDQMIAGRNAPSYNYNTGANIQPYNSGNSMGARGAGAPLSPAQVAQMRANRDAQAQQYEQQYLQQAAQQAQSAASPDGYLGQAYNSVYGQPQQQQQRPTKKRLLYKENDDLMPIPPRLFNPDQ